MQPRQIMSGFSELKDLLIQKYKINEDKVNIRLHFTMNEGILTLHDYNQHNRQIILTEDASKLESFSLPKNSLAEQLIDLALKEEQPADFLNDQFTLHGFFRL